MTKFGLENLNFFMQQLLILATNFSYQHWSQVLYIYLSTRLYIILSTRSAHVYMYIDPNVEPLPLEIIVGKGPRPALFFF